MFTVLIIVALAALTWLGFTIIRQISLLRPIALLVAIAATLLTGVSMLHTEKGLAYNGIPGAAATLEPHQVSKMCAEKSIQNSFCYQTVEYRGIPLKILKTTETQNGPSTDFVGWRGSNILVDYFFYLAICVIIAYGVQYLRTKASRY